MRSSPASVYIFLSTRYARPLKEFVSKVSAEFLTFEMSLVAVHCLIAIPIWFRSLTALVIALKFSTSSLRSFLFSDTLLLAGSRGSFDTKTGNVSCGDSRVHGRHTKSQISLHNSQQAQYLFLYTDMMAKSAIKTDVWFGKDAQECSPCP
jgi:hypothetical protein